MSARNLPKLSSTHAPTAPLRLTIASSSTQVGQNGVEFRAHHPIAIWKEMTAQLETPDGKKVRCTGVIVACAGNRHEGFIVSMLFTSLSPSAQALLKHLAKSPDSGF